MYWPNVLFNGTFSTLCVAMTSFYA